MRARLDCSGFFIHWRFEKRDFEPPWPTRLVLGRIMNIWPVKGVRVRQVCYELMERYLGYEDISSFPSYDMYIYIYIYIWG